MKDLRNEVQDAIDRKDAEAIKKERVAWRKKAKRDLYDIAGMKSSEPERKRHRGKAYEWLVATDHQLWCCSGRRWADFFHDQEEKEAQETAIERGATITVSIDQGSDGWGALMYLLYKKKAAVMVMKDPSHRIWRDVWLGLTGAQLKPMMVLCTIVLNMDHGPWGDARWFQSSKEAAEQFLHVGSPDDVLFQRHLGDIAQEVGATHRLAEPNLAKELFDSIPEALKRMSTKVSQNRWFGIFQSVEEFLPWWSRRYVVLAYLGLQEGLYRATGMPIMTKMCLKDRNNEDAPQASTRHEGLDIQKLRRACHNTLHLACVFLGDPEIRDTIRGICHLVRPLRAEFQAAHLAIRSTSKAAKWYSEFSGADRGRKALNDMVELVCGGRLLEDLGSAGASIRPSAQLMAEISKEREHLAVLQQNMAARRLLSLCVNLLKSRLRSLSWSEHGYPGSFARLLLGEDLATQTTLKQMEKDWTIFQHMEAADKKEARHILARSPFQQTVVKKVAQ